MTSLQNRQQQLSGNSSTAVNALKNQLRKQYLSKRKTVSHDELLKTSKLVCDNLLQLPQIQKSKSFIGYLSHNNEIDLNYFYNKLLENNKQIFFPRFNEKEEQYEFSQVTNLNHHFKKGKYNIQEPDSTHCAISNDQAKKNIDCWLVPGVCFDKFANRIGFGKGCYDNFLHNSKGIKIGIGYSWQLIDSKIPTTQHDTPLNILVLGETIIILK